MSDLKTAVVVIGRQENLYAREFVEHYKNLGFTNIIIIDNNYDGEEHFEDVLQDYIDDGFVKIEDYRGRTRIQMKAYTEVYEKYNKDYDFIAFFDFDEFLVLVQDGNISDYLNRFPTECEAVLVNWLCMTDNNLVHYDSRPLMERFTEPMKIDKWVQYQFPDNYHVKSIIRGGRIARFGGNPHTTDTPLRTYQSNGIRCDNRPWQPYDYNHTYLKHFTTKTIEEWMTRKMKVGTPDREPSQFLPFYKDRFFKINEVTQEKLDFIHAHTQKENNYQ